MKKILNTVVGLSVLVFCLLASVSCNKMKIISGSTSFNIKSAGYYYDEVDDGYDFVFVDESDVDFNSIENLPDNYLIVDLPKTSLGTHDITESLSSGSWSFFLSMPGYFLNCYDFESGSITMELDEEAGTVVFKIDGIIKDEGSRIRANYTGPVQKASHYLNPHIF